MCITDYQIVFICFCCFLIFQLINDSTVSLKDRRTGGIIWYLFLRSIPYFVRVGDEVGEN